MLLAFVFASLAALAPQEPTAKAAHSDNFVPALNYAERPVEFWLDELESSQGRSARAVWCLYYHDERSPRVVDALKRWMRADVDTSRAIDSVLNQWGVTFDALTPEEIVRPSHPPLRAELDAHAPPSAMFPAPCMKLDGDAASLTRQLQSLDPPTFERAAYTLLARREAVPGTLRLLIERYDAFLWLPSGARYVSANGLVSSAVLGWTRSEVGSALGEAVADEMVRATDAREQLRWLSCAQNLRIDMRDALRGVVAMLDQPGSVGERAEELVLSIAGEGRFNYQRRNDAEFHASERLRAKPYDDAELESALGQVVRTRLTKLARADIESEEWLHRACLVGQRSELVRDICAPVLIELARRNDDLGLDALCVLCHFGRSDDFVKRRYVDWLTRWTDFNEANLDHVPCLREHDETTLAALRAVFERAFTKDPFATRLACAGLTDGYVEPLARQFLERLDATRSPLLETIVRQGFRGILPIAASETREVRDGKFALAIAAKRAHGLDWSDDERQYAALLAASLNFENPAYLKLISTPFVEAALTSLESFDGLGDDLWGDSDDSDSPRRLLALAVLTPQQLTRFRKLSPGSVADHMSSTDPSETAVNPKLEGVIWDRISVYLGEWRALAPVLAVTRLIPRDEEYLLATLDDGPAAVRQFGLQLVSKHELDTPSIRASVARLADDCDRKTRELARKIRSERAWK